MAEKQIHADHAKKTPHRETVSYPKWVIKRLLWVLVVAVIMLIIGAMIGYKLGGGNPFRVFLPSTWQHIFDFFH